MKIKIIIAAIIAAIGIVGGVTATTLYLNNEEVVLRNSLIGVYEDALERDDISSVIDVIDDGSVSFELNSMKLDEIDILEGSKLSGKVYFSNSALMVDNFTLEYGSNSIDFSAYMGEDSIYIENPQVLGGTYGVDLKNDNLSELLEDSIFAPNSNSQYALDEDIYAVIINSLSAYN
ncbi:MAG: hypothetical protein J6Q67_08045, partial [Clostridia bacterium]|nr:hypothetical protein [Clostridia bacterium]